MAHNYFACCLAWLPICARLNRTIQTASYFTNGMGATRCVLRQLNVELEPLNGGWQRRWLSSNGNNVSDDNLVRSIALDQWHNERNGLADDRNVTAFLGHHLIRDWLAQLPPITVNVTHSLRVCVGLFHIAHVNALIIHGCRLTCTAANCDVDQWQSFYAIHSCHLRSVCLIPVVSCNGHSNISIHWHCQ